MLSFAVGALISPTIGKRFGLENTLIAMIGLLTVGMIIRTAIATWRIFNWDFYLLTWPLALLIIPMAPCYQAAYAKKHSTNYRSV
jgi:CP family cyanate transporter-like MFS transporter